MIHRFYVRNFMSIRDGVELDFRVLRTTPMRDRFRERRNSSSIRLPTVVVFIGPNGSGKTNLLRAMNSTARFISHSFLENSEGQLNYFYPSFNSLEYRNKPTRIELDFDLDLTKQFNDTFPPSLCRYSLEIHRSQTQGNNCEKISYEAMHIYLKNRPLRIFERILNKPTYINKKLRIRKNDERVLYAPLNASLISTLARFDVEPFKSFSREMQAITTNIGDTDPWCSSDNNVAKIYKTNSDLTGNASQFLSRGDLGINRMEVYQTNEMSTLRFRHQGLDFPIGFNEMPSGARQLVKSYPFLRLTLKHGGLAIFDNFDRELHENLATELLQWFQNKEDNPHGAQLFCTSHSSSLLSELEKEEVCIVEKDRRMGSSSAYSVKDIQDIRRTEDLHKLYIGGVLGGLPNFG